MRWKLPHGCAPNGASSAQAHGWKRFTNCQRKLDVKAKIILIALSGFLFFQTSLSFANANNGKNIYLARCAMCHGESAKGTGPLANKSNPPTPNLATPAFRKRLNDYPGVIVSSIILRPNGDLIPRTLRENGIRLPPHAWTINDLRDLNEYMAALIAKK
ncbi:cytochrome c [Chromobacterium vaccinii]|uniref:Cytochrome c n=1 Tax=Chromobacterium vaccinii TaxID=1108595 RepID=A0ABV0FA79_9NEIS